MGANFSDGHWLAVGGGNKIGIVVKLDEHGDVGGGIYLVANLMFGDGEVICGRVGCGEGIRYESIKGSVGYCGGGDTK